MRNPAGHNHGNGQKGNLNRKDGLMPTEQAYAIQAGRELRILVNNDKIPDEQVKDLAKQIAKQIETDLRYPGRIKITMIRETRIIEYAR